MEELLPFPALAGLLHISFLDFFVERTQRVVAVSTWALCKWKFQAAFPFKELLVTWLIHMEWKLEIGYIWIQTDGMRIFNSFLLLALLLFCTLQLCSSCNMIIISKTKDKKKTCPGWNPLATEQRSCWKPQLSLVQQTFPGSWLNVELNFV